MALSFDKAMLGFLCFAIIIGAGVLLIDGMNVNYADQGVNLDTDKFTGNLTDINEIYGFSTSSKTDIAGGEVTGDTVENDLFKGGFAAVRGIFLSIFVVPGRIIMEIAKQLGVPQIFVTGAIVAFVIMLTFSMIYLVFRFRDR